MSSLPYILTGLGGASLLAGFVSIPALRKLAFGDVKIDWLNGELDFDCLDHDECTVRMKDGGFFRVLKLEGMAYDTKPESEQETLLAGRAMALHDLANKKVTLRLFAIKRQRNMSFEAQWPTPVLDEIGHTERQLFASTYDLDWYMVIQSINLGDLEKSARELLSTFKPYKPSLLSGTAVYGFINYLLCGEMLNAECFDRDRKIATALPASDLIFNYETGVLQTSTPRQQYHQIISIRGWPEVVSGLLLAELLAISADLEICHLLRPEQGNRSRTKLASKQKELGSASSMFRNSALGQETGDLLSLINEGNISVFQTQCTISIRAGSITELETIQQRIIDVLSKWRIAYSVDTGAVGLYWFNRLPFKDRLTRDLKLVNPSIAALWTFHNSPTGQYQSPWGDRPLRIFKTPIGQNYAFNFHAHADFGALGHYLVIAPSGAGKSTLMAHLLGGLTKFDVPSVIFDSLEGMRFMVECMGGRYQSIHNLALNPLDCDDSPEKRLHLAMLLRSLGQISDEEIQLVLNNLFLLDRQDRSLNAIFETSFARDSESRQSFARWVTDRKGNHGIYAEMLNAPEDSLGNVLNQSFMTAFNMGDVLNDPALAAPIVTHITDAIRQASRDSKGFCIFIDEAAALLKNDGFKDYATIMYREYRKLGGAVGMAFQDPGALFDSGIADAVLDNTATLILFPNSQGNRAAYAPFGLNDEQMLYILQGSILSTDRTALIIKRDSMGFEESTIINIDLSPFGDALRFYQSGTEPLNHLRQVQKNWGAEWREHLQ